MNSPENSKMYPGNKKLIYNEKGELISTQQREDVKFKELNENDLEIRNQTIETAQRNKDLLPEKEREIISYPEKKRSLVESLGGSFDELKRRTQPIRDKISSIFSEKVPKIDHEEWLKKNFAQEAQNTNEIPQESPKPDMEKYINELNKKKISEQIANRNYIELDQPGSAENKDQKNPSPENQQLQEELKEFQEKGYLDKEKSFFTNDSSKTLELGSVFDRIEMSKKNSDPEVVASAGRALLDLEKAYNNPDDKNGQKKILDTYEMLRKDLIEAGLPINQTFESILNNRMRTESGNERGKFEQNFTILETPSPAPDSAMPDDRAERFVQLRNRFDIIVADNRLQDYDFMKKYDVHEMLPAAFENDTKEGLIALSEFDVEAGRIKRSPVGPMEKRKQFEVLGEKFVNDVFAKANKDTI